MIWLLSYSLVEKLCVLNLYIAVILVFCYFKANAFSQWNAHITLGTCFFSGYLLSHNKTWYFVDSDFVPATVKCIVNYFWMGECCYVMYHSFVIYVLCLDFEKCVLAWGEYSCDIVKTWLSDLYLPINLYGVDVVVAIWSWWSWLN